MLEILGAVCALYMIGGLSEVSEGLGVRGGILSIIIDSAGDDLMMGTVAFSKCIVPPLVEEDADAIAVTDGGKCDPGGATKIGGILSKWEDDDEEDKNVRPSL